jgi:Zn finger protein HypA/HybF involved in hydrogenase expression
MMKKLRVNLLVCETCGYMMQDKGEEVLLCPACSQNVSYEKRGDEVYIKAVESLKKSVKDKPPNEKPLNEVI